MDLLRQLGAAAVVAVATAIIVKIVRMRIAASNEKKVGLIRDWTGDKEFAELANKAREIQVYPILQSGKVVKAGWSYEAFKADLAGCEATHPDCDWPAVVLFSLEDSVYQLGFKGWWAKSQSPWSIAGHRMRLETIDGKRSWTCELVDAAGAHVLRRAITIPELLLEVYSHKTKDDWKASIILQEEENFLLHTRSLSKSEDVRKRRELLERVRSKKEERHTFDPDVFRKLVKPESEVA